MHTTQPMSTSTVKARPTRPRLVIADDSPEMRSLVREALGGEFGEVVEAADGRALFWALLRSSFTAGEGEHVVITDLCMPVYDGLEVLDAYRELQPNIPTVLITAFPTGAVFDRARQLGVAVLAKPFSTTALRRVVREVSHGRHDR